MKKFLTSIIVVLSVAAPLQAQHVSEPPKLVVGIVIDQLRGDYLNQFYEMFGEGGFKRLMREGAYYRDMKYDFPRIDPASAIATLYTGANPGYHGIVGERRYDRSKKVALSSLLDPAYMGNFTDETVSPRNLLVSSITDELKVATEGLGSIYSFAPNYEEALLEAGHAADGAFWIDNRNKKWATSTYYTNIPNYFESENSKNSLSSRLESLAWTPLNSPSSYKYNPYQKKDFGFSYSFRKNKDNLLSFKTSGLINEEVNRMVLAFFDNEAFGRRTYPDFLSLTYYAGAFNNKERNSHVVEMQDLYLRLDKQLEELFNRIDAKVGLKNTLIFVASTGYFTEDDYVPEKLNIPTGSFYSNRATALLNMYLMSVYGQGDWVTGYYDGEVFLNKKLIEDKLIDLGQFQNKAAEFLIQMSGVQDVVTAFSLLHGRANDQVQEFRNGYHRKISGDLLIELQPGWKEFNEDKKIERPKVRKSAILSPLFFFGNNIKPIQIHRRVKATEVAPTVAYFLRIRAPSACSEEPFPDIY